MSPNIPNILNKIRTQKPLILNLTNFVSCDFVANCLLGIGAAPIMSASSEEIPELMQISSALYINIGTINDEFLKIVEPAITSAKLYKKPIILDPVGAGASLLRTTNAKNLASHANIIRGNATEIIALASNLNHLSKGVEAVHQTQDAETSAKSLATEHRNTVAVSGAIDYITDAKNHSHIYFGSPLMQKITGMGCALTAVIAAFHAVEQNPYHAATLACNFFALCGQIAAQKSNALGNFKAQFLDELYNPSLTKIQEMYAL